MEDQAFPYSAPPQKFDTGPSLTSMTEMGRQLLCFQGEDVDQLPGRGHPARVVHATVTEGGLNVERAGASVSLRASDGVLVCDRASLACQ